MCDNVKYKYVHFEKRTYLEHAKTSEWDCYRSRSKGYMGNIVWAGPQRQYTFNGSGGGRFTGNQLNDIREFMANLRKQEVTE